MGDLVAVLCDRREMEIWKFETFAIKLLLCSQRATLTTTACKNEHWIPQMSINTPEEEWLNSETALTKFLLLTLYHFRARMLSLLHEIPWSSVTSSCHWWHFFQLATWAGNPYSLALLLISELLSHSFSGNHNYDNDNGDSYVGRMIGVADIGCVGNYWSSNCFKSECKQTRVTVVKCLSATNVFRHECCACGVTSIGKMLDAQFALRGWISQREKLIAWFPSMKGRMDFDQLLCLHP
jgi:hypothetical protein